MQVEKEIEGFLLNWDDNQSCKKLFVDLYEYLKNLDDTQIEFHQRPGVTYSLRACPTKPGERPLFVLVDVLDADPRWLSVCFYSQQVSDPHDMGEVIPGGLLGSDGLCFDMEEYAPEMLEYIIERVLEASANR